MQGKMITIIFFLPATLRNLTQLAECMFWSWTNFDVLHCY